jgi:uncharacterized membrane protein
MPQNANTSDSKHIQDNDMACVLQAVWGQFWSMGSVAWNGTLFWRARCLFVIEAFLKKRFVLSVVVRCALTGVIAYNLIINLRNPFLNTASYNVYYHVFVWSLCALTAAAFPIFNLQGPSGDNTYENAS